MILPGWKPLLLGAVSYVPASYVLEDGVHTVNMGFSAAEMGRSDDPTTQFACSGWYKGVSGGTGVGVEYPVFIAIESGGQRCIISSFATGTVETYGENSEPTDLDWGERASTILNNDNNWHHFLLRYDSTNGTSDNRVRFYVDGVLQTDAVTPYAGSAEPSSNEDCYFFYADQSVRITVTGLDMKMAFIEVIQDADVAPTDVAFDDGGTWTRKPYAGSHGTYGFLLDGSLGFIDTIQGWDAETLGGTTGVYLDYADLPPYIN